jgi:hypothetical protein
MALQQIILVIDKRLICSPKNISFCFAPQFFHFWDIIVKNFDEITYEFYIHPASHSIHPFIHKILYIKNEPNENK